MDGWKDHLHFSLLGEHVLFPSLHLDSVWHFFVASLLTITLCLVERTLTYAISKNWCPLVWVRRSHLRKSLWRSCLYWVVTLARLLYMLISMTYSAGLILVIVTSLSVGQFVIEYLDEHQPNPHNRRDSENIKEPLLESPTSYEHQVALHPLSHYPQSPLYGSYSHSKSVSISSISSSSSQTDTLTTSLLNNTSSSQRPVTTRPRSKSKPTSIFIHPAQSNLARADAAAQQLGFAGDTDLVKDSMYPDGEAAHWEVGTGRDVARELMGSRKDTI